MKSAQSIQRSAYLIVGGIFLCGGLGFGLYVWNETKIEPLDHEPISESGNPVEIRPSKAPGYPLTLSLRIDGQGVNVSAAATLTNSNPVRVSLPDTLALEPLFGVSLKYASVKGAPLQDYARVGMMQRAVVTDAAPPVPFNRMSDAVIELLPARSHAVSIPLSTWYNLRPGHYELRVNFRPGDISPINGTRDLPPFNVNGAVATVAFDMPLPMPEKSDSAAPKVSDRSDAPASK